MKVYFILAMFLFVNSTFAAQKDDKKKVDGTGIVVPDEGVIYSLPRTGIRIRVKASQTKFVHGPYSQYAELLLGLKNAASTDFEQWVIDDIQFETFSEADPAQVYKAMGTTAALVSLTELGILAGVNHESLLDEESLPVSTFLGNSKNPDFPFLDLSLNAFYEIGDSTTSMAIIPKSLKEKAQEAAHTIIKLRKRRFKSLANAYEEQLPDGDAYEVMVEELAKLEDNYVGLFVGKSYQKSFDYSFDFIPGENSVSGEVVFRFSDTKGVLPKNDLSGQPVRVNVTKLETLASAQNKLKASNNLAAGESGIYYRMPGKAEIKILNGRVLMAFTRATIAQFGTIASLPESLLDGNCRISFHPKTGAIKNIVQE